MNMKCWTSVLVFFVCVSMVAAAQQRGGGQQQRGDGAQRRGPGQAAFEIVPKEIEFEGKTWTADLAKEVEVVEYKGKKALHIVGGEMTYVYLFGAAFEDGVIECDIAGPSFSGLAFRGWEKGRSAEKLCKTPGWRNNARRTSMARFRGRLTTPDFAPTMAACLSGAPMLLRS